jgi:hypothetical protein
MSANTTADNEDATSRIVLRGKSTPTVLQGKRHKPPEYTPDQRDSAIQLVPRHKLGGSHELAVLSRVRWSTGCKDWTLGKIAQKLPSQA